MLPGCAQNSPHNKARVAHFYFSCGLLLWQPEVAWLGVKSVSRGCCTLLLRGPGRHGTSHKSVILCSESCATLEETPHALSTKFATVLRRFLLAPFFCLSVSPRFRDTNTWIYSQDIPAIRYIAAHKLTRDCLVLWPAV